MTMSDFSKETQHQLKLFFTERNDQTKFNGTQYTTEDLKDLPYIIWGRFFSYVLETKPLPEFIELVKEVGYEINIFSGLVQVTKQLQRRVNSEADLSIRRIQEMYYFSTDERSDFAEFIIRYCDIQYLNTCAEELLRRLPEIRPQDWRNALEASAADGNVLQLGEREHDFVFIACVRQAKWNSREWMEFMDVVRDYFIDSDAVELYLNQLYLDRMKTLLDEEDPFKR